MASVTFLGLSAAHVPADLIHGFPALWNARSGVNVAAVQVGCAWRRRAAGKVRNGWKTDSGFEMRRDVFESKMVWFARIGISLASQRVILEWGFVGDQEHPDKKRCARRGRMQAIAQS